MKPRFHFAAFNDECWSAIDAGPVRTVASASVLVIANNFVIHPEPEVIAAILGFAIIVKHYFDAAGPRKADVDIIVLAVFVGML